MTGSSSKLLQIQGKWYQERMQKNTQNLRQKKQKLFYTHLFMSNLGNFFHICSCHFCVCRSICLYFRYQSYFLHFLLGHKTSFNSLTPNLCVTNPSSLLAAVQVASFFTWSGSICDFVASDPRFLSSHSTATLAIVLVRCLWIKYLKIRKWHKWLEGAFI